MEEQLWYIDQQTKALQEFRNAIRNLWDDEASRDLNMRYLNPHQDDSGYMVDGFRQQYKKLLETDTLMDSAVEHAEIAETLSEAIAELIVFVDEDIQTAYQYSEQYKEHIAQAQSLLPEIEDLIA